MGEEKIKGGIVEGANVKGILEIDSPLEPGDARESGDAVEAVGDSLVILYDQLKEVYQPLYIGPRNAKTMPLKLRADPKYKG